MARRRGWKWDGANSRLEVHVDGTEVAEFSSSKAVLKATTFEKTTQTALADTATVLAAQLLTKVLDGTPTAAATYTLPTAALLVAAIPGAAVGTSFYFIVNNVTAATHAITIAAGSGGTADGTVTVAAAVMRAFFIIITNVTSASEAYFVYGLGA